MTTDCYTILLMPELPEVETIRRGLEKLIVGKTIVGIDVRFPKIFRGDKAQLIDGTITGIRRFGKGLVIDLDNGYSLAVHVKMTGQLVYQDGAKIQRRKGAEQEYPNKWTHVVIKLRVESGEPCLPAGRLKVKQNSDTYNAFLFFSDQRRFGWMQVVETDKVFALPFFKALGPEPLRDLDLLKFQKIVSSSKAPIKSLLMNQQKIAGLGNIYVNDALYLAKIHPTRPSSNLTTQETQTLLAAIETVLQRSLKAGGASSKNYVNASGSRGTYQDHFLVYGKQGKACLECGTEISMMRIAGRSTFYCLKCQG